MRSIAVRMCVVGLAASLVAVGCGGGDSSEATDDPSNATITGNESNATRDGGGGGAFDNVDHGVDGSIGGNGGGGCVSSPANMEIPGNGCDDDGDGKIDEVEGACDSAGGSGDAERFAKVIGVCQKAVGDSWGLVAAEYTQGAPQGFAPGYGSVIKAREGAALAMLGTVGSGAGFVQTCPRSETTCATKVAGQNVNSVHLAIKVPANAKGLAIDYNFFTAEWPMFVGSKYNDGFVINVAGANGNGNIAFDSKGNAVDVNNGFFDRCTPGAKLGCKVLLKPAPVSTATCAGGIAELQGTPFASTDSGYDMPSMAYQYPDQSCWGKTPIKSSAGATGWLSSQTAVQPGETIYINISIWNAGDSLYSSLALIDNLRWIQGETKTTTVRPPVIN